MIPSGPNVVSADAPVPGRAPVVPRVRNGSGEAALPLERHVRGILAAGGGVVNLCGRSGSGKTAAIEHLADVFHGEERLRLIDRNVDEILSAPRGELVVYTTRSRSKWPALVHLEMAPWTTDDCIEYLAGTHRGRVAAVMKRAAADPDADALDGLPELWRIVLDVLAADENVTDVSAALRWYVGLEAPDLATREMAGMFCLEALQTPEAAGIASGFFYRLDARIRRLIRHRAVRVPLASECVAAALSKGTPAGMLARRLPDEVIRQVARLVRFNPPALAALATILRAPDRRGQANAAGILHATQMRWRPEAGSVPHMADALLIDAPWAKVNLAGVNLNGARLQRADLSEAMLDGVLLVGADLHSASLSCALMRKAICNFADFTAAKLRGISAAGSDFSDANFIRADLRAADLRGAILNNADLTEASFSKASLWGADLEGATIEGADFSYADFTEARLVRLAFKPGNFTGARFTKANLLRCDLEYLELPGADFREAHLDHALLTGSQMPGANFRGAKLKETGLADVEWEGADLRGADLTGASFHAGSTRSGLVGSTVPCEGSRTGFYTDDFNDREFKNPEEIRKANLRNADLRGAKIAGVDFYLVDLRGARCTRKQIKYLRQCGAILGKKGGE
ncbi:MAG: pentapeptide repeat protein [Phycisphaerales bacterium]|nr:pentapeptide repeat protein [Phycisphaerales bacterium]